MNQKIKKVNKPMFWVGITMIAIAAALLLTVKEGLGMWPVIAGFMGIVSIGASKYRPLK